MPFYVYKRKDGTKVDLFLSITEHDARQRKDGTIVLDDGTIGKRDYSSERPGVETEWARPIHSDSMAVTPDQIPEARAFCEKYQVPTDYDADGSPIWRSRQHKRKFARLWGVADFGS